MKLNNVVLPVVLFAALSLVPATASAQQSRRQEQRGQENRGQSGEQRAAPRQASPRQPQQEQPHQAAPAQSQEQERRAARSQDRREGPPPQAAARQEGSREIQGRAAPRSYSGPERGGYDRREAEHGGYQARVYPVPRGVPYRPYHYARPYYVFRPRRVVVFGLWIGYPVPYPYYGAYANPGPYDGYPPPPPPESVDVAPGTAYGGVSFSISPPDAQVFVDGEYVGNVSDFAPDEQPLTLNPGVHRIEIDAEGYRPMVFDANVPPGQVIPYSGDLQPY